jgi:adenine-specific DNA methylase
VADLARREKQIQQSYRPVIGIHKWFARRPGTVFRALLLSEFGGTGKLRDLFFRSNDLSGLLVADPFMGGGTPVLEANRLGCSVIGVDINPVAFWIVRQALAPLNRARFLEEADRAAIAVEASLGSLYETTCVKCGNSHAQVKYFIWVKQVQCQGCDWEIDLFPGYLIAKDSRHTHFVLVCGGCGALNQVEEKPVEGSLPDCCACREPLHVRGPAARGRCVCPSCGSENRYPQAEQGPPTHRLIALEYSCTSCRGAHSGRFFKAPDEDDLSRVAEAERRMAEDGSPLIPDDVIPEGDETTRLRRWGYHRFRELFNRRQLFGLKTLAEEIVCVEDDETRFALSTVFSDFLRYQNMLCRYDTYALKCQDIFSVHGFPVGLIQCEANLLGIPGIGSGGFRHFVAKYGRAKSYCEEPFETAVEDGKKRVIRTPLERIEGVWVEGIDNPAAFRGPRSAYIAARSSRTVDLPPESLDAVLTDPPYFANVQYSELMDFCYHWLRRLVGNDFPEFQPISTRSPDEVMGNVTQGRGLAEFTKGLSEVYRSFATALKKGAPFVFTYHHNSLDAYLPVIVAILDAGLVCSASFPCPAEMGASLHINGTSSATVDTIFVCRRTGTTRRSWLASSLNELSGLVSEDLAGLRAGGCMPTEGDAICLAFGHLARITVWNLRHQWDADAPLETRMQRVGLALREVGSLQEVTAAARDVVNPERRADGFGPLFELREPGDPWDDVVSF